ncbi:hypothetical protein H2200_003576 [Cladophialophora chaetospira]|uniref:Uncharacterized protein n=1 Tax=Cladophialophora chaetospira TaxID=386627 RepID=A0AA38XEP0_9EURO|nr:hypothetical protein H2200_003576 [Cladophialophora chaetospira]
MSLPARPIPYNSRDDLELGFQTSARPTSQLSLIQPPPVFSNDGVDESRQNEMASTSPPSLPPRDGPHGQQDRAPRRKLPRTLDIFLKLVLLTGIFALNVVCVNKLVKMTQDSSKQEQVEAAGWITAEFWLLFLPLTPVVYIGVRASMPERSRRQRIIAQVVALLFLAIAIYLPFGLLYDRLTHD